MKKILLLLLLLPVFASAQKTTPGNYTYIAQKYEWDAGIYKGLGLPSGSGPAAFITGQVQRAGAVYFDTLGVDAGFYIYNGTAWVLQGTPSVVDLDDELIQSGYVIYSGTGLKFYITPSIARINGIIYGTDQDSVTLSAADPDDPRKDVIYLATTGVEVLTGTPAGPAAEPQLDADQIKLTVVDVPALATTPGITQQILYDENTESTVTGTGVVVNSASAAEVYRLTVAIDVGTLSNADVINIVAALPTLAWDLTGVNSLDGFIKLKAVMPPEGRLRIQLYNGSTAIGAEANLIINKSFLGWQPFSIPVSAFGNVTSLAFTRVRIRYNTTVGNYAGFTLDYTYLQDGIVQPGPGGAVNSVNVNIGSWPKTGPTTGDVVQTFTGPGPRSEILRADLTAERDSSAKYVGDVNSLAKSPNGANINPLTNEFIGQDADIDDRGFMTAELWRVVDTLRQQTIENGDNTVDTLVYAIDAYRTAVKSIKDSTGIGIVDRGNYLAFYSTGGGSGGFFTPNQTSTGATFHDAAGEDFTLDGVATFNVNSDNMILNPADYFDLTSDSIRLKHDNFIDISDSGDYYMTVTNKSTGAIGKAYWPDVSPPNIIVQTAGGGEPIWYTSGDTLYLKSINGATTDTDSSLTISGGSGGFFTPNQTSTGNTLHDGDNFDFRLRTQGGITFVSDAITDSVSLTVNNQRVSMYAADAGGLTESKMEFALADFLFDNHLGDYQWTNLTEPPGSTNKMYVWDSATNKMHVTAIPSGGGGGSSTFIGLTDVPASFSGQALKVLRANAGETALEFVTLAGGGDALTTDPLDQFAATTSAQLASVISNETGTGLLVYNSSPTFAGTITTALTASRTLVTGASSELAVSATTATEIGYVNGVTSAIQTQLDARVERQSIFCGSWSPGDLTQNYFSAYVTVPHTSSATAYQLVALRNCKITGATIRTLASTAGSNESWSLYIRVNNTTDYLIETIGVSANERIFDNNALSITLNAGDTWVVKSDQPTWVTNPATVSVGGYFEFLVQ